MLQKELAALVGVNEKTAPNWERYDTVPLRNMEKTRKLCEALGLDYGDMRKTFPWSGRLLGSDS